METIQITKTILPGIALGIDSSGETYYIKNGDLYLGKHCEVEIQGKIATLKELNYDFSSLIKKHGDKDGLINNSKLQETYNSNAFDRIFLIEKKWCFPSYPIKNLIEIVISNNLWSQTSISVSQTRTKKISRATIFGIDFTKTIFKALKEGIAVTHLYQSNFKNWGEMGVFADFLIKITKTKEQFIEFNSWQAIGQEQTLFYVHGILDVNHNYFTHIDFAFHTTTLEEIEILLSKRKDKPVLIRKKKILRIDGKIEISVGFELMKSFFPIHKLVDEFYSPHE